MNNIASLSKDEVSQLRREFDQLKADLHDARSYISDLTGDAVRTAKAGAAEARQRINHTVKAAAEKGKESVQAIEHQVTAHPLMSLGAVFAVGLILGFGLTRRG